MKVEELTIKREEHYEAVDRELEEQLKEIIQRRKTDHATGKISTKNFLKYIFKKFIKFVKRILGDPARFERIVHNVRGDGEINQLLNSFQTYLLEIEKETNFKKRRIGLEGVSKKKIKKNYSYGYVSVEQVRVFLKGEALNTRIFRACFKYFLQNQAIVGVIRSELSSKELKFCYIKKINEYIGTFFL